MFAIAGALDAGEDSNDGELDVRYNTGAGAGMAWVDDRIAEASKDSRWPFSSSILQDTRVQGDFYSVMIRVIGFRS